jgi:hypothetical protein
VAVVHQHVVEVDAGSSCRGVRSLVQTTAETYTLTGKGVRVEFVKEHLTFTGEDSPMASGAVPGPWPLREHGRP